MAPGGSLQGFLNRSSTRKPKASSTEGATRQSKGSSQVKLPSPGFKRPNSDAFTPARIPHSKDEMAPIHNAFDTDAESIGDTTTQSFEKSNIKGLVGVKRELNTVTRPELLKTATRTDFGRSSEDTTSNAVEPPTEKRDEDSGSSFYPKDYVDSEGSDEEGVPHELNHGGLAFLKGEEQAEWERFNARDFGAALGSANKPKPKSNVVHLPQRNSSIPSVQQSANYASERTPPRASTSFEKTSLAVREKPLPEYPPDEDHAVSNGRFALGGVPSSVLYAIPKTRREPASSKDTHISISSRVPSQDRLSTATPTQQSFNKRTPDYSSKQLARMSYTDLANESFDYFPGHNEKMLPVAVSSQPLEERLEHLLNLGGMVTENARASMRATYLASLPLDEFERCGQWLAQNIEANIELQSSLRQRKRSAAQAFENELMERMALIKRHKGHVDTDLRRLKVAGSNMVAGKALKGNGTAGPFATGSAGVHNKSTSKRGSVRIATGKTSTGRKGDEA